MGPLIRYTDRLYDLLDEIVESDSKARVIAEKLLDLEGDREVMNDFYIKQVDISSEDYVFQVVNTDNEESTLKIGTFIRHFLAKQYSDQNFFDFMSAYNEKKGKFVKSTPPKGYKPAVKVVDGTLIEVPPFKFNPKDIRSTFISLVTETYPHGHEEEVLKYLPTGLSKDRFGNYYKVIGSSKTMFTSHLDTADRKKSKVNLYSVLKGGDEIIQTDKKTILGADDKAGVAIMLYMMAHQIPGLYYFFIGEERGGIGSYNLAGSFDKFPYLQKIEHCVSFDRRNTVSVINNQLGRRCCSDKFAQALCQEYTKGGLKLSMDSTGVYTDSASFIEYIAECTNISVGYMHEHTINEFQNISYLERLGKACLLVDWAALPTDRKAGLSDEIKKKYGQFIKDLRQMKIAMDWELVAEDTECYIWMELDGTIHDVHLDLMIIDDLCQEHKIDPDITFGSYYLRLELK